MHLTDVTCLFRTRLPLNKYFKVGKEICTWSPAFPSVNPRKHSLNESPHISVNKDSTWPSAHRAWETVTTGRMLKRNTRMSSSLLENSFQSTASEKTRWHVVSCQHCKTIGELLIKWIKSALFQWILFLLIVVAKKRWKKNANWKERCKIICTQKSSVTWMRENIWKNNGVLAGLEEKLEKTSPRPHFSPLGKAAPQPHFQGRPSPWKMLVQSCRNGRGPQMPIDVSCPHGDATCAAYHTTGWPCGWLVPEGIWDAMNCNMLSCFLKWAQCQMPKSPLPGCVSSHWTSGCPGVTWGGVTVLSAHAG